MTRPLAAALALSIIVMMIGTALAMGAAMQVTGGDRAIADGVMVLAADAGPTDG